MAKTYTNQQLAGNELIKDSYTKINTNSGQVNTDLTDLYSQLGGHTAGTATKHVTSVVTNDSSVTGTTTKDALNTLKTQVENAVVGGSANSLISLYRVASTGTANAYVGTFAGQAIFTDMKVLLIPANDNTGASTFNYGASGVKNIKKISKGVKVDTKARDIRVGEDAFLVYDGTDWLLLNGERDAEYSTTDTTYATVKALPATAKKGELTATVKGDLATNTIPNGDFSNGTTGWLLSNATASVTDKIFTATGNGTASLALMQKQGVLPQGGNHANKKIYVRSNAKVTNPSATSLIFRVTQGVANILDVTINNPVENDVYSYHRVVTLLDNTDRIDHRIYTNYVDSATANGKTFQVDGSNGIGVMCIVMTGTEYENYTADQMNERFPTYFEGTTDVDKMRVVSVGKNLAKNEVFMTGVVGATSFSTTNDNAASGTDKTIYRRTRTFNIQPGTYRISSSATISCRVLTELEGDLFGSMGSVPRTFTVTKAQRVHMHFRKADSSPWDLDETTYGIQLQIESGSIATAYEPYLAQQAVCSLPMRSLPNGIRDEFNANTGRHTKHISDEVSISGTMYDAINTSSQDYDLVTTSNLPLIRVGIISNKDNQTRLFDKNGVEMTEYSGANISYIGGYALGSAGQITFVLAKGTYADLAAARIGLGTTKIYYQLDASIVTMLPVSGILNTDANGTMYQEPYIQDVGRYTTNVAIEDTAKPISTLVYVNKVIVNTGELVSIPLSSVTVAGDGLTFTVTGAVLGDYYDYGYNYSTALTINAGITYTHAMNTEGQVDSLTKELNRVSRTSDFQQQFISTLEARLKKLEDAHP